MRSGLELENGDISFAVLGACFEIANELGSGFLEAVYKNALFWTLKDQGYCVETEKRFEVVFKERKVGYYVADLVIENLLIVELKCCESLRGEHQAQLINYLKVSGLKTGLLVNFGNKMLEYKRLNHPDYKLEEKEESLIFFDNGR